MMMCKLFILLFGALGRNGSERDLRLAIDLMAESARPGTEISFTVPVTLFELDLFNQNTKWLATTEGTRVHLKRLADGE